MWRINDYANRDAKEYRIFTIDGEEEMTWKILEYDYR